jgi:hypothetical protein
MFTWGLFIRGKLVTVGLRHHLADLRSELEQRVEQCKFLGYRVQYDYRDQDIVILLDPNTCQPFEMSIRSVS